MSLFTRAMHTLPFACAALLAALLAACGGGSADSAANRQAGAPVVVVDPPPPVVIANTEPDSALFVSRAQQAHCADRMNRIYVIDKKYAFLARAGNCGDAAYAYELFGATPDLPLCSKADSIAGPQASCKDAALKALFDTMVANLDKADLGLGATHKVDALSFLPADGTALPFDIIAADTFSGIHTARNLVIKDQATLTEVWAEHASVLAQPAGAAPVQRAAPLVDFSTSMVIAAFAGNSGGCHQFGIRRITTGAGKIIVGLENRDINPVAICMAVITAPMQMVVVKRSDAAVQFAAFDEERLPFVAVDDKRSTALTSSTSRVIKSQAEWVALWNAHRPSEPAPAIDFSKQMVAAYFLGSRPNGCYAVGISGIFRSGGRIGVDLVESIPGPAVLCTQSFVFPYVIVTLERSDLPVEFWSQVRQLR